MGIWSSQNLPAMVPAALHLHLKHVFHISGENTLFQPHAESYAGCLGLMDFSDIPNKGSSCMYGLLYIDFYREKVGWMFGPRSIPLGLLRPRKLCLCHVALSVPAAELKAVESM